MRPSYLEASNLCVTLGRVDEALLYAEKALQIDADCLGTDHELYRNSLGIVGSLRARLHGSEITGPCTQYI